MQFLETIRLRTSRAEEQQLGLNFVKQITKNIEASGLTSVRLYGNALFPYDFYTILSWSLEVPIDGSPLGLGMAKKLERYGLVDYCVWVEYGTEILNTL